MATCDWVIISDYVIESKDDKLSLLGIFDIIRSPTVPVLYAQLVVATRFSGNPNETIVATVELVSTTTSKTVVSAKGTTTLGNLGFGFVACPFFGTRFLHYGVYAVNIVVNGSIVKTASLVLTQP